ncbi:hypothetical protein GGX14DRAFT_617464 [Mycena pura]|uniref:Uncharacterized protein n=1 Tax=Mycena pura TaxID=153505 RepID=A0AAD6VIA0_9AGAR|nr:hypothetical protein GGX14DRAFT_617464 [Mycena pura]
MLWAPILLFCSVAVGALNLNVSSLTAILGGNIGNMCAVQADTGDTRIIYQELPSNNIMQIAISGPFATTASITSPLVSIPGANVLFGTPLACFQVGPGFTIVGHTSLHRISTRINAHLLRQQGFYYLAPDFTVNELYFSLADRQVHGVPGNACSDCIQTDGFIASRNTVGMYALATAEGGRRVGFLSSDQDALVEADKAATGEPYVFTRLPPTV